MESIKLIDDHELAQLNEMLKDVQFAVAMSMSYVRKFQGWTFPQLTSRIQGISTSTWQRYFQGSYNKMRPLHLVAAYSWLTMLPMACFYRGMNIREAYPELDDITVDSMIHTGLLPTEQFNLILAHINHFLSREQQQAIEAEEEKIKPIYGSLQGVVDNDFMFPKSINIDDFAADYYGSLATRLKIVRDKHNISEKKMAKLLNLTDYRYAQCENPDNPVPLPVELGARLQIGLRLPDAMFFTMDMKTFPQFHTVRAIQQLRQLALTNRMKLLNSEQKKGFAVIVSQLSAMYLNVPE